MPGIWWWSVNDSQWFTKSKRAASERDDESVLIAFSHKQGLDPQASQDAVPTLKREGGGNAVMRDMNVRRLTPRECERLQGFPDDWTAGQPDSSRYRQMGNAVAVPVVEWILRRLVEVDAR
jgi:site-specific DNA-cytosine methylase